MTALFGANRMSVAMLDVDSGAMATYGHDAFDTASIVKADYPGDLCCSRPRTRGGS
ncbi:hypothetical protein STENM327S_07089 [Streptomyces tendae]